jgi:AmpE protein
MTLICLLAALALELHFKLGSEYRKFSWLSSLRESLSDLFEGKAFFDGWGGVALLLLLPIVSLYLVLGIFDSSLLWPLLFLLSSAVLFYSLGPTPLENSFNSYIEAVEQGDFEGAHAQLKQHNLLADSDEQPESDELIRSTTRLILVESAKRYFGVITWFILLGPVAALGYRLAHVYYEMCAKEEFDDHYPLVEQLIHWLDWIPARVTSFMFLLTGDFVNGFYRVQDYLTDVDADNNQLVSETGVAALGLELGVSDNSAEENIDALAMVKRAIIFYLVIGAIFSLIF